MKVSRELQVFAPVHITIKTARELDLFISIIDKLDAKHCNSGCPPKITAAEYGIIRELSDAFTNMVGLR